MNKDTDKNLEENNTEIQDTKDKIAEENNVPQFITDKQLSNILKENNAEMKAFIYETLNNIKIDKQNNEIVEKKEKNFDF